MLKVDTPNTRIVERDYILRVVLGEFLGMAWIRNSQPREDVCISIPQHRGEVRLPDVLFSVPEREWLTETSMPQRPLAQWDSRELTDTLLAADHTLPIIYGDCDPRSQRSGDRLRLPVDVFGAAFFMLTRYEEWVVGESDEHDRFPAWASLAAKEGFLRRPIIDEYVEILFWAMGMIWPGLSRKKRVPSMFVTCDVDNPYAAYTRSAGRTLRKMGGDLVKRNSVAESAGSARNAWATWRGDYRYDPYDTFDWIMDVNESAGNRVTFYFLVDRTVPEFDAHYSIDEPRVRSLLRRIHQRGHEIGLHGSYGTFRNYEQTDREACRLREVMAEEGIEQRRIGGRQHYLRWSSMGTAHAMERSGLAYDASLGYADQCGFRCGTAQCFPLYDLGRRGEMALVERPLVVMECSVLAQKYMGVTEPQVALAIMTDLKSKAFGYGGSFGLLWHNSYLGGPTLRELYSEIVRNTG